VIISFFAALLCFGDLEKISEAIGNMVGKDLQGISIDYEAFVRGVKQGSEGKEPSMDLEECLMALGAFQAEKNLKEANEFLAKNLKEEGIVSVEKGKVLYCIKEEGTGETVQSYDSPLIRYEGKTLSGQVFASSEEVVAFDSIIEGLGKGIQGMREGEKRTLYIHPDLGFGSEDFSMPNMLLIFDVEVIKANSSGGTISSDLAELKEGC